MSDTTERLRQVAEQATPGEMYAGGRNADHFAATFRPSLVAAMLDVIEAAEAHGHANEYWERDEGLDGAARLMEADEELHNSVARFREVAGE